MAPEGRARYPYFGEPPARKPRPAAAEPALLGKRVILSTPEGFVYDMRAASEVHTDGDGRATVDIVTEHQWFSRTDTGTAVEPVPWPLHLVWVE